MWINSASPFSTPFSRTPINSCRPVPGRWLICLLLFPLAGIAQQKTSAPAAKQTLSQIKAELERSDNPPLYVKDVLKKKFRLDTVTVMSRSQFMGIEDSIAYHGKLKKVYGPFKGKILLQPLATIPTHFNHIQQIFLDTSVFLQRFADSLASDIINRINSGQASFEDMARSYSMGGEAATNGDLGWLAEGVMIPQMEKELSRRKKDELFKVWTPRGLHILRKIDNPVRGNGHALIMRIFL
ncbi:MAG TPA: peptidylprolyl isomerase [Flavitalea sp.]|nr:peptidylprolyl isomerase [Flavitalea sp.]